MLITRGFGTGTGSGPGETIYVPITDPDVNIKESGYKTVSGRSKLPVFVSEDKTTNSPEIDTKIRKTNLDLSELQPKITTNIPKF